MAPQYWLQYSIPMKPVLVDNTGNTKIILVCIKESILLGCYYRQPMNENNTNVVEILEQLAKKFPEDHLLLVDDMNIPGINWSVSAVKLIYTQKSW